MFGDPIFSFDRSLSLSIIYVFLKIKNYCGSLICFNFSALASSKSAIIEAARLAAILEVEFN